MRIALGLPVLEQHELTAQCVSFLERSVAEPTSFELVLVDNGSTTPYAEHRLGNLPYSRIRNDCNRGFYFPLKQLYDAHPEADILILMHNDLFLYEQGWDRRLKQAFANDPKLGMVGLCGSWQADAAGGRGTGTMCNFRGERGAPTEGTGERITELRPAVLLDSLFIAVRRSLVPTLAIDEHIPLCHFYDKVWPLRTIEAGWRVGVLGIDCDHLGGQTAVLVDQYREDAARWCEQEGIPLVNGDPKHTLYLEAERRFLSEYRDAKHLIPCSINQSYEITS